MAHRNHLRYVGGWYRLAWLLLIISVALGACGGGEPPPRDLPPATIPAPVLAVGEEATVEPGATLPLRITEPLGYKYRWILQGPGALSREDGVAVNYTAPQAGKTSVIISVTAFDDQAESTETAIIIHVEEPVEATVGLETLGIPAGWFTSSAPPEQVIGFEKGTPEECAPFTSCMRLRYNTDDTSGGIIWWPSACGPTGSPEAWQKARQGGCGVDVVAAGNMTAVNKFTFSARGATGGEMIQFKVGADDIAPSPARATDFLTLTSDWQPFEIDLNGVDLTRATALFTWVADDAHNPDGAVFYLADLKFVGTR